METINVNNLKERTVKLGLNHELVIRDGFIEVVYLHDKENRSMFHFDRENIPELEEAIKVFKRFNKIKK